MASSVRSCEMPGCEGEAFVSVRAPDGCGVWFCALCIVVVRDFMASHVRLAVGPCGKCGRPMARSGVSVREVPG